MATVLPHEGSDATQIDFVRWRFNNCSYLFARRSLVTSDGEEIRLRSKTRQVFEILASQPNELLDKEELINRVWGDVIVTDDTLNQSIREIRKALGDTERKVLETVSRQGYILHAVELPVASSYLKVTGDLQSARSRPAFIRIISILAIVAVGVLSATYAVSKWNFDSNATTTVSAQSMPIGPEHNSPDTARENLHISVDLFGGVESDYADGLVRSVITELSRYSNIDPTRSGGSDADYRLELAVLESETRSINLQVHYRPGDELVLSENIIAEGSGPVQMAKRIAALIGSPAGGAIGHHLIKVSRTKAVEELTRPECLAHGYGCTSCSGEFDSISQKAVQCIANILEQDSTDPDAWALQSTIYSRQYLWGSSLQEPMRSNKDERHHLKSRAVEAATRAEALADGSNPSVYWGMVQAYLASCDADRMHMAIERGLDINSNDPNMLAVYGNFLSYAGKWDQGKALVEQAQQSEPRFFKKWWYMSEAKWHYKRGEYQQAYDIFIKSFNERNWLSHLQLAYTLPHLGRVEEAKQALQGFMRVAPGMTREHVYEFYRSYCFDDDFLSRVKTAFDMIGMPSRGSGDNLEDIRPIRASVKKINDRMVEYVDVGEGLPVVFVHGSFSDYRTWSYMLIPMSEKHRYIAYTQRYFGTQPWPTESVTYDLYVDEQDLIAFIEHLGVGAVVLVGWSRGVQPAVMVARSRPDLVSKLVLYEGTVTELDPENGPEVEANSGKALQEKKMMAAIEQGDYQEAVKWLFEIALQHPPNTFEIQPTALQKVVLDNARTLTQLFPEVPSDRPEFNCDYYSTVNTPALVIHGENTDPWWQYESETMADCLPDGKLEILAGATHDGPLSRPQELTELISDYIADIE